MTRTARSSTVVLVVLLTAGGLVHTRPAVAGPTSTTSNEIVYTATGPSGSSIVLRDLQTKAQSSPLHVSATTSFDTPELSPTGDKVVASYDNVSDTTETFGITVVNRGGIGRVNLTALDLFTDSAFDIEPTFSPDGNTVLFTRVTAVDIDDPTTYTYALWTVPTAGGAATALPGGTDGFAGTYKPGDAGTIAFSRSADPETGIGPLTVLSGGTPTSLGVDGRYPKYSPSGSTLAYSTSVSATVDRLATVAATGGTATVFPSALTGSSFVGVSGWLPDGESILFELSSSRGFELWAVDARGTRAGIVLAATATSDASGGYVNGPAPTTVVADPASTTFVPVSPTRLLDTRTTNGGHLGKVAAGEALTLQVSGRTLDGGGTVPNASAVVLNVTAASGTAATVVRVFPAPASPLPTASNLNTTKAGQIRANHVTVKLGSGPSDEGKVVLYNGSGQVHLIADIAGYYVTGAANQRFGSLEPGRILDTRNGTGAPAAPVGQGGFVDLDVVGSLPLSGGGTSVVPGDATAVVLNVTGTAATAPTNIRAFPTPASGAATPLISNLNLAKGETAPNLVTVTVGDGGRVRLFNAAGSVHLIADLAGYYSPSATGGYVPVVPVRFLDSRDGTGAAPITTSAGGFIDLLVRGTRGLPTDALGVVLNLTGTSTTAPTFVVAYPSTSAKPTASNLNLVTGDSRANAVVALPGSTGRLRIGNNAGTVHLIADLAGYFVALP